MSMLLHFTAYGRPVSGPAVVLALCLVGPDLAHAVDTTPEHVHLAAALRQIDVIERLVAHEAERPQERRARYHFDYVRLRAELQRMQAGVQDYLVPQRAQPRDPVPLTGDYVRREERQEPSL